MTVHGQFGMLVYNLCYKLYYGVLKAGNGHGFRVYKVEPTLGDWP